MKIHTSLESYRSDKEKGHAAVFGKVGVWKSAFKKSRKILVGCVAVVFLSQILPANTAWAALPLPTAAELTNPQTSTTGTYTTAATATTTTTLPMTTQTFLASGPLTVSAATTPTRSLYVSVAGSDQGNGSSTNPYKTIRYAVSQLRAGDTLNIRAGTYKQVGAVFSASGTASQHITIQGIGTVVIDNTGWSPYTPAFDTKGRDYIDFFNLTVNHARDAVEVSPNSSYITIDGLHTNGNHFAVKINGGEHVTVRNAVALNSRNAFRTEAAGGVTPSYILFENIETAYAKDIYTGYEKAYRNGDGFILEAGNNITIRNVVSHDNWDGGFDVKANNVLIENVIAYGNKNNFKTWGSAIVVKNALSRNARYLAGDPVAGEGNGLNARMGRVTFINSTFVDNDIFDVKVGNAGSPAYVTLVNCIISRKLSSGRIFTNGGGVFTEKNNLWYWQGRSNPGFAVSSSSLWADPKFVDWTNKNFHLQSTSAALDKGSLAYSVPSVDLDGNTRVKNASVDLGVYEFGGTAVQSDFSSIQNGATVSGMVTVGPNLRSHPGISRVTYTLNGMNSGDVSISPFYWGGLTGNGTAGFDTRTLANGTYTLKALLYESTGTHLVSLNFIVNNAAIPSSVEFLGVTAGAFVSGTVNIRPNLALHPTIRKVSYYLNGTQSGKVYASPYLWGGLRGNGTTGMDTKKLSNGTYTLGMCYTDDSGDHVVTIAFKVRN